MVAFNRLGGDGGGVGKPSDFWSSKPQKPKKQKQGMSKSEAEEAVKALEKLMEGIAGLTGTKGKAVAIPLPPGITQEQIAGYTACSQPALSCLRWLVRQLGKKGAFAGSQIQNTTTGETEAFDYETFLAEKKGMLREYLQKEGEDSYLLLAGKVIAEAPSHVSCMDVAVTLIAAYELEKGLDSDDNEHGDG